VLSEDVLRLLRSSIKSVWSLELLLLLRRRRGTPSQIDWLATETRSSEIVVTDALAALVAAGLVEQADGGFVYAPKPSDLDYLVHQLETAYAERPTAVVKAIISAPSDKIQNFANAFRLKKD
jgi:hypothetical protein